MCASSQAGRSVRSDSSDGAFEFLGGFWGDDTEQFGTLGFDVGRTEFKLNINPDGSARFFTVCMSEDGFLKLISSDTTCADSDYALSTDWELHCGVCDRLGQHLPVSSGPHARIRGLHGAVQVVAGRSCDAVLVERGHARRRYQLPFDVQIVLIDRSNGTNNGNFDIELNYGRRRRSGSARWKRIQSQREWLPGFQARAQFQGSDVRAVWSVRYQRRIRFASASAAANGNRPATNGLKGDLRQLLRYSTRCCSASSFDGQLSRGRVRSPIKAPFSDWL